MNAIISRGDKTAHVQLPVERKQLAGALSYLGANHTSDYDLKYNEENKDGLKISLECFGVVENAIAKGLIGISIIQPHPITTSLLTLLRTISPCMPTKAIALIVAWKWEVCDGIFLQPVEQYRQELARTLSHRHSHQAHQYGR